MVSSQEVKRDIRLVSDHPAIVRNRRDVEQTPGCQLNLRSVLHCRHRPPRDNHPHMLHAAEGHACNRTHMFGPLPPRLVACTPYRHSANLHNLELPLIEDARFIRSFKPLQYYFDHFLSSERRAARKYRVECTLQSLVLADYLQVSSLFWGFGSWRSIAR